MTNQLAELFWCFVELQVVEREARVNSRALLLPFLLNFYINYSFHGLVGYCLIFYETPLCRKIYNVTQLCVFMTICGYPLFKSLELNLKNYDWKLFRTEELMETGYQYLAIVSWKCSGSMQRESETQNSFCPCAFYILVIIFCMSNEK